MSAPLRSSAAILAVAAFAALAQPARADDWTHEFAPYLWGVAKSGTSGIGAATSETHRSFGDILEDLESSLMVLYRATGDRYTFTVDAAFMGLGYTDFSMGGALKSETDLEQLQLEADVGYLLGERWSIVGGLRYMRFDTEIEVTSPLGPVLSVRRRDDWVDPVVGAEYTWPLATEWSVLLRGDVGGFGLGSDLTWQGFAILRWQPDPRFGAAIAYRYIDVDYSSGRGDDRFTYDMATSGPAAGIVFTF